MWVETIKWQTRVPLRQYINCKVVWRLAVLNRYLHHFFCFWFDTTYCSVWLQACARPPLSVTRQRHCNYCAFLWHYKCWASPFTVCHICNFTGSGKMGHDWQQYMMWHTHSINISLLHSPGVGTGVAMHCRPRPSREYVSPSCAFGQAHVNPG